MEKEKSGSRIWKTMRVYVTVSAFLWGVCASADCGQSGCGSCRAEKANLTGKVTVDGKPRQGVVVSDGINVVVTDSLGAYAMHTSEKQHVFVSVPADCEIPVLDGAPSFFQTITFSADSTATHDFAFTSTDPKTEWTLLTMADPQVSFIDVSDFEGVIMPQLKEFASTLTGDVYGIALGDLVWNTPELFEYYRDSIATIGVPVFKVIGNHDHNENIKNDDDSDREFRDAMGPTYYSVNIGDCHLVALDDILYRGVKSRNDYSDEITAEQLEWLKADLSHVDRDKMIIIGLHAPTKRRNTKAQVRNNQALYDIVKDFKEVQILSGHSHYNVTTTIAPNITETTFGAVMGAFWYPLCNDGSPRGYAVLRFDGNHLADKYYIGAGLPRDYQMKLYAPDDAVLWDPAKNPGDPYDKILANIFCWHDTWTVEVKEDDGSWVTLADDARLKPSEVGGKCWDPDVRKSLVDGRIPANHGGGKPCNANDHMFLYTPSAGWRSVTFRASDPYGNVYTSKIDNKK